MKIIPVLLAGGIGERFWPQSRKAMPKQMLQLASRKTMIAETLSRVRPFCRNGAQPLIVTGKPIAAKIRATLPKSTPCDWIVEPCGKNTAPAVAAAAAWIMQRYGDAVMVILSADHAIQPASEFTAAVKEASRIAQTRNNLVIFGIRPDRPETGYGYIHLGKKLSTADQLPSFAVRRFVEKPDQRHAETYLKSGDYLWNSGMFVWKASVIMDEFKQSMPVLHRQAGILAEQKFSPLAIKEFYEGCIKESIDYGIMEKARDVAVVCGNFTWDDIGSWESMLRVFTPDANGSVAIGPRIAASECANSIVVNRSKIAVAACGLDNMVVVATPDALLVIPRAKLPEIKKYLAAMKSDRRFPATLF
jgi:mannose-1-phosphate guanylyltransferase